MEDFVTEAIRDALTGEKAVPDVAQTVEERVSAHLKDDGFTYHVPDTAASESQEQVDIKSILTTLREEKKTEEIQKEIPDPTPEKVNKPFDFDELTMIGAVFNTYIAAQDENSFYLIDQHAAHERIFYEKLLKQYSNLGSEERILKVKRRLFSRGFSYDLIAKYFSRNFGDGFPIEED